jgi:hypothetical protein
MQYGLSGYYQYRLMWFCCNIKFCCGAKLISGAGGRLRILLLPLSIKFKRLLVVPCWLEVKAKMSIFLVCCDRKMIFNMLGIFYLSRWYKSGKWENGGFD